MGPAKKSPLAMVPHKNRKFLSILYLSFSLRVFGMEIPSVNEATHTTAPQHSMHNLGSVLPQIIAVVVAVPAHEGGMVFSKLDIKDSFWRMIVEHSQYLNFAYVLPDVPGARICLVIPSSLQMGWTESLSFFCAETETARGLAEVLTNKSVGSLPPHPLEAHMPPHALWPESSLHSTCTNFLQILEVYVDDFCSIFQTSDVAHLRHVSCALFHSIHSVFPPPEITGHTGGDPVSLKKLLEGEGTWDVRTRFWGGCLTVLNITSSFLLRSWMPSPLRFSASFALSTYRINALKIMLASYAMLPSVCRRGEVFVLLSIVPSPPTLVDWL